MQKSRMMQQKQLALARLHAKKLHQTQLPGTSTVLPHNVSPTSDKRVSRSWAGDSNLTSASTGWRAGPPSDEWQHSNQGPHFQSSHANADVRWDDRVDDSLASSACNDGNARMFHRGAQDSSGSSSFQQKSANVPTEVVGEWRCPGVRKRPAPGSSMSASSGYFKPSPEPEPWQIFKSQKTSPETTRFNTQLPGIYKY